MKNTIGFLFLLNMVYMKTAYSTGKSFNDFYDNGSINYNADLHTSV